MTRIPNRFSFTIECANGAEKFDNLVGKQSLQAALSVLSEEATEILNAILESDSLYNDPALQNTLTVTELLELVLRGNITVYSDWEKPATQEPEQPTFEPADYAGLDFVGTWTGLFNKGGEILSHELILSPDGTYSYRTSVNGVQSVEISGVYRIENGAVALKTFVYRYEYSLLSADDLKIEIAFAADGLLAATFIKLSENGVTSFNHMMTRGNVRPASYYGRDFVDIHKNGNITVELLVNGTANIS